MDMNVNTTTTRRRALALALAAAAPLGLLACSDDPPERAAVESSAESGGADERASTTEAGDSASSGADTTSTTAAGGPDGTDPGSGNPEEEGSGEVLGSSTGQHPADPNDSTPVPLRLDVVSLERLPGEVVEARFTITNEGSDVIYEPWRTLDDPAPSAAGYAAGGAALVDLAGDKRYLVLFDSEGVCLCTGELDDVPVEPGQALELYAQLTAPPEDVTEVGFTLPGFAPVNGLVIS